jgi:hypothetical protein
MKTGEKIKNYCPACCRRTNHLVLFSKEVHSDSDIYIETYYYSVIECAGCSYISYLTENVDAEDLIQDGEGNWLPSISIEVFPKVIKNRKQAIEAYYLPDKIKTVYSEAIKAFAAECYLLSGVAFRAVIEAICLEKKIAGRDLSTKITNLVKSKLITEKEAERLHPIRFMGNDSVHEMAVPTTKALYIVLNIIEHLLNNLYIIDEQIKYNLETVISNFADFKILLSSKIKQHKVGESLQLTDLLGKSYRRLHNKVSEFEIELQKQIDSGEYLKLKMGDIISNSDPKKVIQKYIIEEPQKDLDDEPIF